MLRNAEIHTLEHLKTYAVERARHQQAEISAIHGNLEIVRSLYLGRLSILTEEQAVKRWDERVERYPTGPGAAARASRIRGKRHGLDQQGNGPLPASIHRLVTAQVVVEDLMPSWVETFPSLLLMFPARPVSGSIPSSRPGNGHARDYPLEQQEWYAAATPARNPSRRIVWTGVYADPISHIPYASVLLPIERTGITYGTIGHDIPLRELLDEWTRSDLPHALHMIFEPDGDLIAHPELEQEILASKGALNLREYGRRTLEVAL